MKIYILERSLASNKNLAKTEIELQSVPMTVRDLITSLVEFEVRRLEQQSSEVEDAKMLSKMIKLGKVGFNIDPRTNQINLQSEVEKAHISYAHQDYFIFIDDLETTRLDDPVILNDGSTIAIIANVRFR